MFDNLLFVESGIIDKPVANVINTDSEELIAFLWDYQEVSQPWRGYGEYGGISEIELCYLLNWGITKFYNVLEKLLGDPNSGVIRTPSGGIAYTW